VIASSLPKPKPSCLVCGTAVAVLCADLFTFTLRQLVGSVLKTRMAFVQPMVTLENFMYEEGDDLTEEERDENEAHLSKTLAALPGGGMKHNMRVIVTDQVQDMTVTLIVQQAVWPPPAVAQCMFTCSPHRRGRAGFCAAIATKPTLPVVCSNAHNSLDGTTLSVVQQAWHSRYNAACMRRYTIFV
jgi:hypothetical protein